MKAIGMIETKGLLAAIESADAMLKAADVVLIEKTLVGGGLVTITVSGDVAAVKASVDAGAAAVERISGSTLVSRHVIPRPHEDLKGLVVTTLEDEEARDVDLQRESTVEVNVELPTEVKDSVVTEEIDQEARGLGADPATANKSIVDQVMADLGRDGVSELLKAMRVVKLRALAREYADLAISGRAISEANKQTLILEITNHYKEK